MAINELERGRSSFVAHDWLDAYNRLSAADRTAPLEPPDLENLAMAAYLVGKDDESVDTFARAHQELLARQDPPGAARCAFWLWFQLVNKGDMAQASGWFERARRVLDESQVDCVECGYALVPVALQSLFGGDGAAALTTFGQAAAIGARFQDPDLIALTSMGRGQSLITMGDAAAGMATLDEVMVAVTSGEVSAIVGGLIYCAVINACQDVFDLRRAQEWTEALSHWCASQPDLVPYRGQCLVHRAEIMQLHGAWADAMQEAQRARELLSRGPEQGIEGMAWYQMAELHRLRGDFRDAEESYRHANQSGQSPQPGLAQLRLAQGQVDAAEASIRRVIQEAEGPLIRARVLPAYIEIELQAGDVKAARAGADELSAIAIDLKAPLLLALASHAQGAVLLAESDAPGALTTLRSAWKAWRDLEVPHAAARARVLIGLACRQLGDADSAEMEFDAARQAFRQLESAPDLVLLDALSAVSPPKHAGGLTGREMEVLALVATGKTNREIAEDLVISEKTVARHLSNIFIKLDVSSRAAATSYAYRHDLV
ncbi:MAG TPA: LuxR C-terminal-related transcriptional regulator [Actinomycetota bacterium]|nr:LuxR C-terminal-related transcriptional regulator [Actinomycetota bacterium]